MVDTNSIGLCNRQPAEFHIWKDMRRRCYSKTRKDYARYGGRGITVCDRWRDSFASFFADMGPRPSPAHSLDRHPDPFGPYAPDNCRWATVKEQNRNRRDSHSLTVNGTRRTIAEWAEITGLGYALISNRVNRYGWDHEKAVKTPVGGSVMPTFRRGHRGRVATPEARAELLRLAEHESCASIARRLGMAPVTMQRIVKELRTLRNE